MSVGKFSTSNRQLKTDNYSIAIESACEPCDKNNDGENCHTDTNFLPLFGGREIRIFILSCVIEVILNQIFFALRKLSRRIVTEKDFARRLIGARIALQKHRILFDTVFASELDHTLRGRKSCEMMHNKTPFYRNRIEVREWKE